MKDIKLKGIVDMTLTPENAPRKGYRYVDDVLYDVFALSDSLKDILQLAMDNGFKLGIPSPRNDFEFFYGLYAPQKREELKN